jgi:hypothetical protein
MGAPPFPLAGDSLSAGWHGPHRPAVGIGPFTNRQAVERPNDVDMTSGACG